ncbi:nucleotidyltransferase domain-containing protein [Natronoflexus pectinivorans]|uniref:Nucleotidyltransferase-like protein n=1 Tax=Natronoflexus pectinivorans TaxID=682526 RepID=A0A4R2GID0_9BACT|nr:nucleotidyltransferase domain-containing protein [Natronoflexus pectinivorans]TCO07960.1 nucleotidyltransferase-like protein [Natronoflexus pectinivorans]
MDKGEALKIANQYLDKVSSIYVVLQAYMIGSFAKGTNHADSDIDIALVVKNVSDIIDTQIELMKMRRNVDLRIEPHPFVINDFNSDNPVVNEILTSGIPIKIPEA